MKIYTFKHFDSDSKFLCKEEVDKEINLLKQELKREREAVDMYADTKNWEMHSLDCLNTIKETDLSWHDYMPPFRATVLGGGKLARETQKQRVAVL